MSTREYANPLLRPQLTHSRCLVCPVCSGVLRRRFKTCVPRPSARTIRCRANSARIRQPGSIFGLGFQVKVFKAFKLFPLRATAVYATRPPGKTLGVMPGRGAHPRFLNPTPYRAYCPRPETALAWRLAFCREAAAAPWGSHINARTPAAERAYGTPVPRTHLGRVRERLQRLRKPSPRHPQPPIPPLRRQAEAAAPSLDESLGFRV